MSFFTLSPIFISFLERLQVLQVKFCKLLQAFFLSVHFPLARPEIIATVIQYGELLVCFPLPLRALYARDVVIYGAYRFIAYYPSFYTVSRLTVNPFGNSKGELGVLHKPWPY